MAVEISNIPKISFSMNEIAVSLTSDNYLLSEGRAAVYLLDWNAAVVLGDFISMQFNSKVVTITCGLEVNHDRGDKVKPQEGMPKSEYVDVLVTSLNRNHLLSEAYIIDRGSNNRVRLTARKPGTDFSILSNSQNFNLTVSVSPANHTIQQNFNHYIEIWSKGVQIFESLLPLNYPVDGKSTMDISGVLHSQLDYDIPDLESVWQTCTKSILPYTVKYANSFGDPFSINALEETSARYVALGGYSRMALLHIDVADHLEKYLLSDPSLYQAQRWFESYPIDDIEVKTNQPQFLYFVNSRDVTESLRLKVSYRLEDDTEGNYTITGGAVASFEKRCIAVGYKQLGLDARSTEAKKVISYKVQLIATDGTPRSVEKSFSVNRCYEANTRYFLYAGSDGNFKTLRTYGSAEGSADFERESGVRESNQATRIQFGDILTFDVVSYENEIVSTGYIMSRHSHEAVKEFMLSQKAFRVIGNRLIPIEITSKEMPLPVELSKTGFIKIEYRLAWDERLFTGDSSALNVPVISESQEALNDI